MFNPKIEDFMEDNPDITMIGLIWSLYWRFIVIMFGVYIVLDLLALI